MDEDGAGRRGGRGAKFREKLFFWGGGVCEALTVQTRFLKNKKIFIVVGPPK